MLAENINLREAHFVAQANMTFHLTSDYHFDAHAPISLNNRILDSLPTLTFQLQVLFTLFRNTSVSSANLNMMLMYFCHLTHSVLYT